MHAKLLQSCPTLCDPIDGRPPGSSVHSILQARILGGLPFPSPLLKNGKLLFPRTTHILLKRVTVPHSTLGQRYLLPPLLMKYSLENSVFIGPSIIYLLKIY